MKAAWYFLDQPGPPGPDPLVHPGGPLDSRDGGESGRAEGGRRLARSARALPSMRTTTSRSPTSATTSPCSATGRRRGTYLAWLDVSRVVERIGAKETAAEETAKGSRVVSPRTGRPALVRGERPRLPEPRPLVRNGRRRSDADEHRIAAEPDRAGARQHGRGALRPLVARVRDSRAE